MAITNASRKAKGRGLQQRVAKAILAAFPHLQPDDCQSCAMGSHGEDVKLSPAARAAMPYQIECKKRASMSVWTDYKQARSHGKHEPVLIVEADRGKPLAVISLDHFLELVQRPKS